MDSLIAVIGNLRMKNVGPEKYASVANTMRNAARLHLQARELDNQPNGVIVVNPKSFDRLQLKSCQASWCTKKRD